MIIRKVIKPKAWILPAGLALVIFISSCNHSINPAITSKELQNHVKYLSSDQLEGRLTGSTGDSLAAEYIKTQFKSYGLVPVSGDGFERFRVNDKISLGKENSFSLNGTSYTVQTDFSPASFSENASLKADVIFAGYGFRINNDSLKWDDYKDLDVKNKWIMIIRSSPDLDNPASKFASFSGDRNKAMIAKDLGASGILMVSGPSFDSNDTFDPLSKGAYSVGIPVLWIKRTLADAILLKSGNTIKDLEKKLNSSNKPYSFITGTTIEAKSDIVQNMAGTRNVVMMLPGSDEKLKNEFLIFGAHFDHLGMGGPGSGSRAVDTLGIHHGADDNASGVSMVIELARRFAGTKNSHKRSLIFVAFTGEEEGLLGSKHFSDDSMTDLKRADLMVNLDMVGRLQDSKFLQVGGVGTSTGVKELAVSVADTNKLKLSFTEEGSGSSDFSSFYAKNIPVLYFTTGTHDDYHTPKDTWEKINYPGMVNVADLVFNITSRIANDTARLKFKEAGPQSESNRPPRRRGITLGIMPDVTGSIKNGLKVEAVTAGRPAALGGMKKGDIIISVDGKPVNNIGDYMFRLSQLKSGQKIEVEVMRNEKKEVLVIQL
jgi:aminopeptidase YwaD